MSGGEYSTEAILKGHTSSIVALEFSPDGKFLASGAKNGVVLIFSTSSWVSLGNFIDASPISVVKCGDFFLVDAILPLITTVQERIVVGTSTFNGPIRSMSIFPASRRAAIAYGSEIVLTKVLFNPPQLSDERKPLPKPPSASQFSTKLSEPIATSLHFFGNKDHLLVTYATHGIIHWDTSSMTVVRSITPRTCTIGRSVVNRENTILAVPNLIDGVDWYSLSKYTFISTTKPLYAQKLSDSSTPTFLEGDKMIVGGTNGEAHIFGPENLFGSLGHTGAEDILSTSFASNVRGRKFIAIGAAGFPGAAGITIWSAVSRRKYIRPFAMFKDAIPTTLAWNQILVLTTLLLLSSAWVVHLIGELMPI
ncbi:hypothetical protein BJ322DRAFT_1111517 [Thelephora terrestris]|uniref:Anaphase-promoting complex subunit 4 WD40 domain-containing protein n=1 Tax=Thelephora terrestris TaxID=56493 RepID=A0A9P6L4A8_9AGAM|nr:hypothetical protein BJ322DRAFT_1111517 [Thelephora terrestris]